MFCIQIAGIPIGIDNRYPGVKRLCSDYIVEKQPLFTVSVSEEDLLKEQGGNQQFSLQYCESLCIYRQICLRLPQYDAFLLHSAVLAVDGDAYVFTAPSGTGKTTHLRLWLDLFGDRVEIVNGDKPVFRFIDGALYACGTPWQGKACLGSNIMRPVRAVCFLEQSPANHIRRLQPPEISERIFHQILIPKDLENFDRFWQLLEKLITSVDFYLLQCNRDLEAAQLAYQTMCPTCGGSK